MRVALVHDWLVGMRGGERVLEGLCELFPAAEIFTLLHSPGSVSSTIERHPIHTSFLERVPGIHRSYRKFLPAFPFAIESFDLSGFDFVLSSSHCVAKGIRRPSGAKHLSYVHAPMRYMWELYDDYFGPDRAELGVRLGARISRSFLRQWDLKSAKEVDAFVANSHHTALQVAKLYGRAASVVHPPVDVDRFVPPPGGASGKGGYFLWVGALAPYKRADLAIEAFRGLDLPLWIAGSGQDAERIAQHLPANVTLLGQVSDDALPKLYREARALIFPGVEDFGITPLEVQAAGRPVIALARGGALETVTPETGVFFSEQTSAALAEAVRRFAAWEPTFDPMDAQKNAARFSMARFKSAIQGEIDKLLQGQG